MIRTVGLHCAPILHCSKNDRNTPVETASDEVVMGVVLVLCEFSLSVSQRNHSDLYLTALSEALKQFHQKKGAI